MVVVVVAVVVKVVVVIVVVVVVIVIVIVVISLWAQPLAVFIKRHTREGFNSTTSTLLLLSAESTNPLVELCSPMHYYLIPLAQIVSPLSKDYWLNESAESWDLHLQ